MTDRAAAKAAKRDRARARERFVTTRAGDVDLPALEEAVSAKLAAPRPTRRGRAAALQPKGFPTGDQHRWVPIGPSVVLRGQGTGRPRVTGRIRDLAVHPDGRRAYAASARGGVWYTGDGGATWAPVGGWAQRQLGAGGPNNAQSCGALLVEWGADVDGDFVLVGTGETTPFVDTVTGRWGGLGVLVGKGPAGKPVGDNPWEPESGLGVLHGLGVYRLARSPSSTAESTSGAGVDKVLAATSGGLFLGTRTATPSYGWVKLAGIDTLLAQPATNSGAAPPALPAGVTPPVTDVLWLPSGDAKGRIVVAVHRRGIAYSDDEGASFTWLRGLAWPRTGQTVQGRSSIARAPGTDTLYVLTGLKKVPGAASPIDDDTALFRIADITPSGSAEPQAVRVRGVPSRLWPGQRDYDQALDVDVVQVDGNAVHRVYLAGSYFEAVNGTFDASLWCFHVSTSDRLEAAPGISRRGLPDAAGSAAGDGAVVAGHIGMGVHADVHAVRLVGAGGATPKQLWVGCDGGVYVSAQAGRPHTFAPRCTGLAVLEPGFSAVHPTSSHVSAAGLQDNGTQVRTGDTVWEEVFEGDGGGLVIDPVQPHRVVAQYIKASWSASPAAGFVSPTSRAPGGGVYTNDRENDDDVSAFYSGAAAVRTAAGATRLAVGTNRVWVTDDLGTATPNTWRALPFPSGAPVDARPNGTDPANRRRFGVPANAQGLPAMAAGAAAGPLNLVVALKWESPTSLLVLFHRGVVRWVETAPGTWQATVVLTGSAFPAGTVLTDVAPIDGTDFYLTTTGNATNTASDTCYLCTGSPATLNRTNLRDALDQAGPPPVKGPLDPAYAVVVDPTDALQVYVGTVTGVWHGVRTTGTTTVAWGSAPFVNGLPQAAVQDLTIHHDPASPRPRLLRASVQARGLWEVDLSAPTEPVRTYLRVHPHDDRRRLPTPMTDVRQPAAAPPLNAFASPDVVVRPRPGAGTTQQWLLDPDPTKAAGRMTSANAPAYQLWTFQTAFRWQFPSVLATGRWTPAFEDLLRRRRKELGLAAGAFIDKPLWDSVLGTRIDPATGAASTDAAHPLAVYREPWHTAVAPAVHASEVDLVECVQPPGDLGGVWQVYREPSRVDVLLHHRDTRPLTPTQAHALLLWRAAATQAELLALPVGDLCTRLRQTATAGTVQAMPAGWQLAGPAVGSAVQDLGVRLDARIPRATAFDVDLGPSAPAVPLNSFVLLLAVAWSDGDRLTVDPQVPAPVASATLVDLVRGWPYAAMRIVQVTDRPVAPPPGP